MSKVFGIGFHKTGTTSLGVALERLGYTVCHGARPIRQALGPQRMLELLHRNELDPILQVAEGYDAFEDNPWFLLYRDLDRRFPGSRFILTYRDPQRWIDSACRYYGSSETPMRRWIYGTGSPIGHESRWLERYGAHNHDVQEYFRGRPGDLLVVDWEQGAGWRELAEFLGRPMPDTAFPRIQPVRSPA